jgi:hypothetical protein
MCNYVADYRIFGDIQVLGKDTNQLRTRLKYQKLLHRVLTVPKTYCL